MKIAITASTPDIESAVDPRFADGPYFVLVDTNTQEWQAFTNPASHPLGGHGGVAARFVLLQEADAVVSDDYCPHGFAALVGNGVDVYRPAPGMAVRDVLKGVGDGSLERVTVPSRGGHHNGHQAPESHGASAGRPIQLEGR
jgi:predicted Fe-Mo cluster-binding NifX family protein